jgi:hypothetical protein
MKKLTEPWTAAFNGDCPLITLTDEVKQSKTFIDAYKAITTKYTTTLTTFTQ